MSNSILSRNRWLFLALVGMAVFAGYGLIWKEPNTTVPVNILAAYSMLAPASNGGTIIYGRLIVDGYNVACPSLKSETGSIIKTTARGRHPDAATGTNNFPVTVCETTLSAETNYYDMSKAIKINAVSLQPSAILIYGDSGCKTKDCATGPARYFEKLAEIGIKEKPELILHMGDYNYRGTSGSITGTVFAYDAGDGGYGGASCGLNETYYSQNATGSPRPDSWANWNQDFFVPARALLSSAPWVFARGNHELCSRAGPGWFYFFGPGSSLPGGIAQGACPNQGDFNTPPVTAVNHISMIPPYLLEFKHLRLWVMDSANACDAGSANSLTSQYQTQFEQLQALPQNKTTWMMTHRPLWGIVNTSGQTSINTMLQTALVATKNKTLPTSVTLSLSGHMHLYQSLTFTPASGRPSQLVVGNSGIELEKSDINGDFQSVPVDGVAASGNGLSKFGLLSVKFNKNGTWHGAMLDEEGSAFVKCDSKNAGNGKTLCELINGK